MPGSERQHLHSSAAESYIHIACGASIHSCGRGDRFRISCKTSPETESPVPRQSRADDGGRIQLHKQTPGSKAQEDCSQLRKRRRRAECKDSRGHAEGSGADHGPKTHRHTREESRGCVQAQERRSRRSRRHPPRRCDVLVPGQACELGISPDSGFPRRQPLQLRRQGQLQRRHQRPERLPGDQIREHRPAAGIRRCNLHQRVLGQGGAAPALAAGDALQGGRRQAPEEAEDEDMERQVFQACFSTEGQGQSQEEEIVLRDELSRCELETLTQRENKRNVDFGKWRCVPHRKIACLSNPSPKECL